MRISLFFVCAFAFSQAAVTAQYEINHPAHLVLIVGGTILYAGSAGTMALIGALGVKEKISIPKEVAFPLLGVGSAMLAAPFILICFRPNARLSLSIGS